VLWTRSMKSSAGAWSAASRSYSYVSSLIRHEDGTYTFYCWRIWNSES
jgi:hypothetical protein